MPKPDPPNPDDPYPQDPYPGDPTSLRRRRAAQEEAEALRAEVVRWVREGEAGREASEALRSLFREGLESAVRDALADGEVARSLAEGVRGELAGVFEEEIRDEVARQVRTALADGLFSDEELEALRRDVRKAVGEAVTAPAPVSRPSLQSESPRRAPGGTQDGTKGGTQDRGVAKPGTRPAAARGPGGGSGSGGGRSAPGRPGFGRRPSFGRVDWSRPGVLAGLAALLAAGVLAIWFFALRPVGDATPATPGAVPPATTADTQPSTSPPADPADPADPTISGDGTATGPAPPAGDIPPLYDLWRRQVAPSYPAPDGVDAPLRERFACWFSGAARDDLAEAVREAEAAAGPTALENRLRTIFPPCINDDAVGPGANPAVYAAQAAAHRALRGRADRGWAGCRQVPDPAPDLAAFRADGIRGPGTYAVLDALATCRGMGRAVSFDGGSDVTDYLFVLYLALADLEGAS